MFWFSLADHGFFGGGDGGKGNLLFCQPQNLDSEDMRPKSNHIPKKKLTLLPKSTLVSTPALRSLMNGRNTRRHHQSRIVK